MLPFLLSAVLLLVNNIECSSLIASGLVWVLKCWNFLSLSLSFVHAHFYFEKIVHAHLKKVLSLTRDFELILDDFG